MILLIYIDKYTTKIHTIKIYLLMVSSVRGIIYYPIFL
jgi:hypothetical protein